MVSREPLNDDSSGKSYYFNGFVVRSENTYRTAYLVLATVFLVFIMVCFIAPFLNEPGLLLHLNGSAWVMDHSDLWETLDPFSQLIYSIGDIGCHQSHGRTLHLNDNEMPICTRDTFLLIGFFLGFLLHGLGFNVSRREFLYGLILVAITPVEWAAEHYLEIGGTFVRAVVSVVSGIGATMIFNSILMWETRFFDNLASRKKRN